MQTYSPRFQNVFAASLLLLTFSMPIRAWSAETLLNQFSGVTGDAPGANPYGGLIGDSTGNLYGTTSSGGTNNEGVLFELIYSPESGTYSEKVLYNFKGEDDGGFPVAGLIRDAFGNLYGTTEFGGGCLSVPRGCGVVFELAYSEGGYSSTPTVLHTFTGGNDGGLPVAALLFDGGNLYGTASCGGSSNCVDGNGGNGVVFELANATAFKVLFTFPSSGNYGSVPKAPLIRNSSTGNLYSTTEFGGETGACDGTGCGVVFELVDSAETYSPLVLHAFEGGISDGGLPLSPVVADEAGNLYGTTTADGSFGDGVVFEIESSGTYKLLYSFGTIDDDGAQPTAGLALAANDLYGTTYAGGTSGLGTVFTLHTSGAGYQILHSFLGGDTDGANPFAGVTLVGAGESMRQVEPLTSGGRCTAHCAVGATVNGGKSSDGAAYQVSL
jgi:uncharacterized repeat protein (TIGR03803 family)